MVWLLCELFVFCLDEYVVVVCVGDECGDCVCYWLFDVLWLVVVGVGFVGFFFGSMSVC